MTSNTSARGRSAKSTTTPPRDTQKKKQVHGRYVAKGGTISMRLYRKQEAELAHTRKTLDSVTKRYKKLKTRKTTIVGVGGVGDKLLKQVTDTMRRIGQMVPKTVSAAELRSDSREILDEVPEIGSIAITRHGKTQAVLVSVATYAGFVSGVRSPLTSLSQEFEGLLKQMRSPKSVAGALSLFEASPEQLGKSAAAAARSRG